MIAYIDVFHMMMIATILSLPLVLILKKPGRPKTDERPVIME